MDIKQVTETIAMIEEQNFDVRTITMGISLLDCIDSDINKAADKIYKTVVEKAGSLVQVGDEIAAELGIPIVNKRVSVTPISIIGAATSVHPQPSLRVSTPCWLRMATRDSLSWVHAWTVRMLNCRNSTWSSSSPCLTCSGANCLSIWSRPSSCWWMPRER